MFRCPHCDEKGIPPLRKLILSPGFTANCSSCGGAAGIGYPSWLIALIPGSVLMLAAFFVESETTEWTLNIVGIILMIIVPFLFSALRKEE